MKRANNDKTAIKEAYEATKPYLQALPWIAGAAIFFYNVYQSPLNGKFGTQKPQRKGETTVMHYRDIRGINRQFIDENSDGKLEKIVANSDTTETITPLEQAMYEAEPKRVQEE